MIEMFTCQVSSCYEQENMPLKIQGHRKIFTDEEVSSWPFTSGLHVWFHVNGPLDIGAGGQITRKYVICWKL